MNTTGRFPPTHDWTPEQALAVFQFCQSLADTLCDHYEDILFKEFVDPDYDPVNLELPFDDEILF